MRTGCQSPDDVIDIVWLSTKLKLMCCVVLCCVSSFSATHAVYQESCVCGSNAHFVGKKYVYMIIKSLSLSLSLSVCVCVCVCVVCMLVHVWYCLCLLFVISAHSVHVLTKTNIILFYWRLHFFTLMQVKSYLLMCLAECPWRAISVECQSASLAWMISFS